MAVPCAALAQTAAGRSGTQQILVSQHAIWNLIGNLSEKRVRPRQDDRRSHTE